MLNCISSSTFQVFLFTFKYLMLLESILKQGMDPALVFSND